MASAAQMASGAVLCAATIALLAFRNGGFDDPAGWRVATVGLLAAAALAVVLHGGMRPTRLQLTTLLALAALAGWTALSALWSPDPESSVLEAQRAAVYVAAVVAAVAVRGRLLAGTLAGIALVCLYALGQRLLQGPPSPPDPFGLTLLQEPLGYANALAALAAIGLAVSLVLALERQRRLSSLTLAGLLLATLALTGSRGGWVAAAVGAVVGLALAARRPGLAAALAGTAGIALALALALPAGSFADDTAPHLGDRAWYWHVAWQEAGAVPIAGRGAGTFELAWLREQPIPVSVLDAHSLYLEAFAELGLIGLGLLVLALAPAFLGAFRGASAAAAAGYVAFLLHAGIDWDWEMPAVVVAGLFCGAALLQSVDRSAELNQRLSPADTADLRSESTKEHR